ncbi:MAG TPA: 3-hydroxyacyl-CoA dehydrogenase family protein [Flavitalea sp.]|nr:3-hydroxyacyl-CoA dehydrogenase family protein [Flavitalea sp.]
MKRVAILASSLLRTEIEEKKWKDTIEVNWVQSLDELLSAPSDAYFDLAFDNSRGRITALKELQGPVFISETIVTAAEIDQRFIRINSWPGMVSRPVLEMAAGALADIDSGRYTLDLLGLKSMVVPDIPGFISCRILATIINEAYYTLEAGVSSRKEIDTAMKLGTNYPYGPFEWAEKIGINNIIDLLNKLSTEDSRYQPAELLTRSTKP